MLNYTYYNFLFHCHFFLPYFLFSIIPGKERKINFVCMFFDILSLIFWWVAWTFLKKSCWGVSLNDLSQFGGAKGNWPPPRGIRKRYLSKTNISIIPQSSDINKFSFRVNWTQSKFHSTKIENFRQIPSSVRQIKVFKNFSNQVLCKFSKNLLIFCQKAWKMPLPV